MHYKLELITRRRSLIRRIRVLKRIDPKHAYLKPLRRELREVRKLIKSIGSTHLEKVENLANYI